MVKAILINSADPHRGPRPNFQAGWGLINLRRAVEADFQFDAETTLTKGQQMTYDVDVAQGVKELRVTLVWADAPGGSLVNDLNLEVRSPADVLTRASDPDGNEPDDTNNVEGVDVRDPAAGQWKVTVTAPKVTAGLNQPFAVVISQSP